MICLAHLPHPQACFNGLPLSNMSDTMEQNLRNRLGEEHLPPLPGPDARGILM